VTSTGSLWLVAVGDAAREDLEFAATIAGETTGLGARILPARLPVKPFYDPARDQVNATKVLGALLPIGREAAAGKGRGFWRILGVTDHDLFMPVLTFVFGEALLGGEAAVVSRHRLREEFYGLPANPVLTMQRLEKEILHELGHTFGLTHCDLRACVMSFANSVGDVDVKESAFCPSCSRSLPRPRPAGHPLEGVSPEPGEPPRA